MQVIKQGYPTEEEKRAPTLEEGYPTEEGYPAEGYGGGGSIVVESGHPTEESAHPTEETRHRGISKQVSLGFIIGRKSSPSPRVSVCAIPSSDPTGRYNCVIEGMEFFPLQMQDDGLMAKLSKVFPAMEVTVNGQVRRTKAVQSDDWRDSGVWKNETLVFKVDDESVDISAMCVNTSGMGPGIIGSARVSVVVPEFDGLTSVQQLNLVRKARRGAPVLAGILHARITFFRATGHVTRHLERSRSAPTISSPKPSKENLRLELSSPAIQRSGKVDPATAPSPCALSPSSRNVAPKRDPPKTWWFGCTVSKRSSTRGSVKQWCNGRLDCFSTFYSDLQPPAFGGSIWGWMNVVCLAVMTGVVVFWLTSSLVPTPVTPPRMTLTNDNLSHCLRSSRTFYSNLCTDEGGGGVVVSEDGRGALYRCIVDVIAFPS